MARPPVEAGGEDAEEDVRLGDRAGLPVGRQRLGGDVEGVVDVRRDGEGDVSKDRGWGAEDDGSREAPRVRISFDRGEKASQRDDGIFSSAGSTPTPKNREMIPSFLPSILRQIIDSSSVIGSFYQQGVYYFQVYHDFMKNSSQYCGIDPALIFSRACKLRR